MKQNKGEHTATGKKWTHPVQGANLEGRPSGAERRLPGQGRQKGKSWRPCYSLWSPHVMTEKGLQRGRGVGGSPRVRKAIYSKYGTGTKSKL